MKYIISLFLLLIINTSAGANKIDTLPDNSPIIVQIKALDFFQFIGKPVDSLLVNLPSGFTSIKIYPSFSLKKATYLFVNYEEDVSVVIAVRDFIFMNPAFSPIGNIDQNWDLNLFKKENLSFAVAFNGRCINGCLDENKIN